jgi:hypothetical protein
MITHPTSGPDEKSGDFHFHSWLVLSVITCASGLLFASCSWGNSSSSNSIAQMTSGPSITEGPGPVAQTAVVSPTPTTAVSSPTSAPAPSATDTVTPISPLSIATLPVTAVVSPTPTPTDWATDKVISMETELHLDVMQVITGFQGVFLENVNSSPLAIADINRDGFPELVVAMRKNDCAARGFWSCPTILQWRHNGFTPLMTRWIVPQRWRSENLDEHQAYTGSTLVADVTGDGYPDLILGLNSEYADDTPAFFVFAYDPVAVVYKAVVEIPYWAPVSFGVSEQAGQPVLLASDQEIASARGSSDNSTDNQVHLLKLSDGHVQDNQVLQDKSLTLYTGKLPGKPDYYVLREEAYGAPPSKIETYTVNSGALTPSENPLPVTEDVRGVYTATNLLGHGEDSLVLLRTKTKCGLVPLNCDPSVSDPSSYIPDDYIEVYIPDGDKYHLASSIHADPAGQEVDSLIIGVVDNDGQDEIVTSTGGVT